MHKLDTMMMNNVRSAAINADCVLVLVDATKMPQKVSSCFASYCYLFQGRASVHLTVSLLHSLFCRLMRF